MDSRDYLDEDGWPVIPDRDRLPLRALMEGAALTTGFTKRERSLPQYKATFIQRCDLRAERDAVAYELTLPNEWHFAPVRTYRDGRLKAPIGELPK